MAMGPMVHGRWNMVPLLPTMAYLALSDKAEASAGLSSVRPAW